MSRYDFTSDAIMPLLEPNSCVLDMNNPNDVFPRPSHFKQIEELLTLIVNAYFSVEENDLSPLLAFRGVNKAFENASRFQFLRALTIKLCNTLKQVPPHQNHIAVTRQFCKPFLIRHEAFQSTIRDLRVSNSKKIAESLFPNLETIENTENTENTEPDNTSQIAAQFAALCCRIAETQTIVFQGNRHQFFGKLSRLTITCLISAAALFYSGIALSITFGSKEASDLLGLGKNSKSLSSISGFFFNLFLMCTATITLAISISIHKLCKTGSVLQDINSLTQGKPITDINTPPITFPESKIGMFKKIDSALRTAETPTTHTRYVNIADTN